MRRDNGLERHDAVGHARRLIGPHLPRHAIQVRDHFDVTPAVKIVKVDVIEIRNSCDEIPLRGSQYANARGIFDDIEETRYQQAFP